jgi:Cellulose binding domain
MSNHRGRVSFAAVMLAGLLVCGCSSAEAIHRAEGLLDGGAGGDDDVAPGPDVGDPPVVDAGDEAGTTVITSCTDQIKNGTETDVDCGGGCSQCKVGQGCVLATDCENGVCTGGYCQPAGCGDGHQNGTETDLDCGGMSCAPCPDGDQCVLPTDCQSRVCTGGKCQPSQCNDMIKNGLESDVDCGGGVCAKCQTGQTCGGSADCLTAVCSTHCQSASCGDLIKNGSETDVDCGGTCGPCANGKTCGAASDCLSGVCNVTCRAPSCTDLVRNGSETDVDCGGGMASGCMPCGTDKICTLGTDCQSGSCVAGKCQAVSCDDKMKNGSETDVDCGGSCATKCDVGKMCLVNADCSGNICSTALRCQSPWKVQYKNGNTAASAQEVEPLYQIISTGGATAPLSEFKIRYYFTNDNAPSFLATSDYALVGRQNITFTSAPVTPPTATADHYMEVGFLPAAGNLVAGGSTGEVFSRFDDGGPGGKFTFFNQTNDYSFDATKTAYADWDHVTLYHNGALVWGVPPQ